MKLQDGENTELPAMFWPLALLPGTFFGTSNFLQNIALMRPLPDPGQYAAMLLVFLLTFNLIAIAMRIGWTLPSPVGWEGRPKIPAAIFHAAMIAAAATIHLIAISLLTTVVRSPDGSLAAFDVFLVEILVTCFPIWVAVYLLTAALIEYVSKQAVGTNEIEAPLKLSESGRTHFVDPDAIELVEAQGNYVKVHLQDGALLVHMSLSAAENMLPGEIFFRAHRSVIVPSSAVLEISRSNTGAYLAHLRNGLSVCVSRRKLTALRAAMDHISKS